MSQVWSGQEFFNWGEIRGSEGAKERPHIPFFLLQNRFGTTAAFEVCFGSLRPPLEDVLGRPMVTCLQAKISVPGIPLLFDGILSGATNSPALLTLPHISPHSSSPPWTLSLSPPALSFSIYLSQREKKKLIRSLYQPLCLPDKVSAKLIFS